MMIGDETSSAQDYRLCATVSDNTESFSASSVRHKEFLKMHNIWRDKTTRVSFAGVQGRRAYSSSAHTENGGLSASMTMG